MYNVGRRLRYLHLLTRHCSCNLLPEPTSTEHEYGGHPMTPSMMSSPWKILFCIIWDGLFISEIKLQLCLIFQNFQNGRHYQVATNFFTGCYTASWIYQQDSNKYFWYFELLIDALAQILTEIYQFQNLTYFVTWWRHQWRHEYAFI